MTTRGESFGVGAVEGAPLQNGNFHRLEIVRLDDEVARAGMIAARQAAPRR